MVRIALLLASLPLLARAAAAQEHFDASVALVEPFEREVGRGKRLEIKGVLKGRFSRPELILIAPDGRAYLNRDQQVTGNVFLFTIHFEEGPGKYRIELVAEDPNSKRSAMRADVYHGVAAPRPPPPPPEPPAVDADAARRHARLLEKDFLRILNGFRRGLRLPPAAWNEAVSARAREHAARMVKAGRRAHKFGGVGVLEMLQTNGAGADGASGPGDGWGNVDPLRPFPAPSPAPPGPRVFNHVVPFVLEESTMERLFEIYFVREPAFRICAADPFLLEVGVGVEKKGPLYFFASINFVQVNDTTIRAKQDRAYDALLREAARLDPDTLRRLGIWGRAGRAASLLRQAFRDVDPAVAAAAFDGLRLVDEPAALSLRDDAEKAARLEIGKRRYAAALLPLALFEGTLYDPAIQAWRARVAKEASKAAEAELAEALAEPDPAARRAALEALRSRVAGLPCEKRVEAELAK